MADAVMAQNDPFASMTGFTNLLNLFKDQNTLTSGTSSGSNSGFTTSISQPNISAAGMQQMLEEILGGTQGLAAVASGQKGAGLYNSTTNQLLVNNLLTQTAGQLAKFQAGTTTVTQNQQQQQQQNQGQTTRQAPIQNPMGLIGGLMGINALSNLTSPIWKKMGGQDWLNNLFSGGTIAPEAIPAGLSDTLVADALPAGYADAAVSGTLDSLGATDIVGTGLESAGVIAGTGTEAAFLDSSEEAANLSTTSLLADEGATDLAAGALTSDAAVDAALAGAGEATTDVAGFTALDAAAADAGAAEVGGTAAAEGGADLLGGAAEFGPYALAAAAAIYLGTQYGPQIDDAVRGAGNYIGDALNDLGGSIDDAVGWVICTELVRQGKMDVRLYRKSARFFKELPEATQKGYHIWAIPVTRYIRKNPTGLVAKFFAYLFKSRCEHLLGTFRIGGWLSVLILEPFSHFLGTHYESEDWRTLYEQSHS